MVKNLTDRVDPWLSALVTVRNILFMSIILSFEDEELTLFSRHVHLLHLLVLLELHLGMTTGILLQQLLLLVVRGDLTSDFL